MNISFSATPGFDVIVSLRWVVGGFRRTQKDGKFLSAAVRCSAIAVSSSASTKLWLYSVGTNSSCLSEFASTSAGAGKLVDVQRNPNQSEAPAINTLTIGSNLDVMNTS